MAQKISEMKISQSKSKILILLIFKKDNKPQDSLDLFSQNYNERYSNRSQHINSRNRSANKFIERDEKNEDNSNNQEFYHFKNNYINFYRGYTPDDFSKRKYEHAERILKAYENIKEDLDQINLEKELQIIKYNLYLYIVFYLFLFY